MPKKKTTLIAGEPFDLLNQRIPSLEVFPLSGTLVHISFPTDTVQGAAWERAIERYAADLITLEQPLGIQARKNAAMVRIVDELVKLRRE